MIYTCTMNTAVDLFVETDELLPDVVNRTKDEDYQPNGKASIFHLCSSALVLTIPRLALQADSPGVY
ncbi:hypothetical protein PO124_21295 [Bacillus licheniformis]|nr:hypothetical protein [Bacillus licheniformis]